jgi:hypothetical protein
VLPQFRDDLRTSEERLTDASLRSFKVACRLSKHRQEDYSASAAFSEKEGESFLVSPPNVDRYSAVSSAGAFGIKRNEKGELSFVEFECEASGINEARLKFAEAVFPFLDYLSYAGNVPLQVAMIRVEDIKNQITTFNFTSPHQPAAVHTHHQEIAPQMKPVYALYREAKNATSDFYRFLCYFKILEGLLGRFRSEAYKEARRKGVSLQWRDERVPDDATLDPRYQQYAGKSIKKFFDDVLTREFRHAVAHFVTDKGAVLHTSDLQQIGRYASIMHTCEVCVRIVIASHADALRQITA